MAAVKKKKRKPKTKKEVEEQKKRWWGPKRNKRRRVLYAQDEEYRENQKSSARESYRRRRKEEGMPVGKHDCSKALPKLRKYGKIRPVILGDTKLVKRMVTFTVQEVSDAMGRNPNVLYRWIQTGMWPEPILRFDGTKQKVFSELEIEELFKEFSEHEKLIAYYRKDHVETKDCLFAAAMKARRAIGVA